MRIVCISDTHNFKPQVPDADVLIHAGDLTGIGKESEVLESLAWLSTLPHKHKLLVAGNHDFFMQKVSKERMKQLAARFGVTYLQDELVEIEGMRIYGSPWIPTLQGWAFYADEIGLMMEREKIPRGLDILITHGPPEGLLDGYHYGCRFLRRALLEKRPKVHVFGHVHENHGQLQFGKTLLINAATCTREYIPSNEPITFEYDTRTRSASSISEAALC